MAGILEYLQSMLGRGDPEAAGAAQNSTAMEPVTGQYMSDVASGQYAKQGVQNLTGAYQWDPNQGPIDNARAQAKSPLALDQAMNVAMGVGPGAIRAYHGSPYNFEKFDSSKIGTGEGAQAYGHGLYFAGHEPVARKYRDDLTPRPAGLSDAGYDAAQHWLKQSGGDSDAAFKAYQEYAGEFADPNVANFLRKPPGHMYEVNINAEPHQFLDWDKLATEQPQSVKDAFGKIWQDRGGSLEGRTTPPFSAHGDTRGDSQYAALATSLGSKEAASAALRGAGIPGIRYLDQGSRAAGQGTSNYVTFPGSDNLIEILRKFGIAGLLGGTAASGQGQQ